MPNSDPCQDLIDCSINTSKAKWRTNQAIQNQLSHAIEAWPKSWEAKSFAKLGWIPIACLLNHCCLCELGCFEESGEEDPEEWGRALLGKGARKFREPWLICVHGIRAYIHRYYIICKLLFPIMRCFVFQVIDLPETFFLKSEYKGVKWQITGFINDQ